MVSTYKPGIALNDRINKIFLSILVLKQDSYEGQTVRRWPWGTLRYIYHGALKDNLVNWAAGYQGILPN